MAAKKPDKWAWIAKAQNEDGSLKYPRLNTDTPEYAEVLAAKMESLRGLDLEGLAVRLNRLEDVKEGIQHYLSGLDADIVAAERMMERAFDATEIDKFTLGGYSFKRKTEPYGKTDDPVALRAWIDEHMPESLTFPWQTLRGLVNRALEGDGEVPPGVTVESRITIERKKG